MIVWTDIERCDTADRFLYHYTSASVAHDHILSERAIKLGSYCRTIDPKESSTWRFDPWTKPGSSSSVDGMESILASLVVQMQQGAKVVCFSTDATPLRGSHLEELPLRGYGKSRMWAQYAAGHGGVCLVFERRALGDAIHRSLGPPNHVVFEGPVAYRNRSILPLADDHAYRVNLDLYDELGREEYVRFHVRQFHRDLFFEKMTDWRDEAEYRWVVFANTREDLYLDYDGALVGLIFGAKTADRTVDRIMEMTASLGIAYMRLKWQNGRPWYDYANPRFWSGTHGGSPSDRSQHLEGNGWRAT